MKSARRAWAKFEERFANMDKTDREKVYAVALLVLVLIGLILYAFLGQYFGWIKSPTPEEIQAQNLAAAAREQASNSDWQGILAAVFGVVLLFGGWVAKSFPWICVGVVIIYVMDALSAIKDTRDTLQRIEWKLEELKPNRSEWDEE